MIVAGQTILPSVLSGLQGFANSSAVKLVVNAMAYKPFISLFNMTGVAQQYPDLAGIGMLKPRPDSVNIRLTLRS